jgi:hypothetical protein
VAAPLAVEVELKEPQGDEAQVTVHVTPVPVLTVAVMDAVVPVTSEVGALTETVTAGGVFELPPPQAVRKSVNAAIAVRKMLWREFIAHLRAGSVSVLNEGRIRWVGGSRIRGCSEAELSDR